MTASHVTSEAGHRETAALAARPGPPVGTLRGLACLLGRQPLGKQPSPGKSPDRVRRCWGPVSLGSPSSLAGPERGTWGAGPHHLSEPLFFIYKFR